MSLQWRLFLQAGALVLLTTAALFFIGGRELRQQEVEQLDERLCMEARRLGNPQREGEGDRRMAEDMQRKLRLDAPDQLRMRWLGASAPADAALKDWFGPDFQADWQAARARGEAGGRSDPRGRCERSGAATPEAEWRLVRVHTRGGTALLAAQTTALDAELQAVWQRTLPVLLPLALLGAAASAWLLAQLMMRPVQRLREAMRRLTPQVLSERLATRGEPREFRELIDAYNTMLARLEASFHQASRFSADAAHELRTPLTILQGRLERAIGATEGRAVQAELGAILEEVNRLSGIARKLLLLSRADAGRLDLHREDLDLSVLLGDLVADAQMLAEDRPVHADLQPGLRLSGDALLLRQLFNNLLSNALRHGLPHGALEIEARAVPGAVEVDFRNACAPLGPEQRARFFERFYRADAAHGRQVDGTGLGLSLAREIARAHGGELLLLDSAADRVALRVRLPHPTAH
ncbi:ATP-binding protein [Inhella proteolytica]|uniref:histidine kinase n=1 Tax=Inhella proteolytica TaxID=2795029 RepID=A0A931NCK8_9BURK|nr:ATP-binding protein [Inhella proteolytica]MBH9575672.1 HAMP domain-containing protein [Inhella proteolytica]